MPAWAQRLARTESQLCPIKTCVQVVLRPLPLPAAHVRPLPRVQSRHAEASTQRDTDCYISHPSHRPRHPPTCSASVTREVHPSHIILHAIGPCECEIWNRELPVQRTRSAELARHHFRTAYTRLSSAPPCRPPQPRKPPKKRPHERGVWRSRVSRRC